MQSIACPLPVVRAIMTIGDTFTRTSVCESKMNVATRAQLTFQMLTLF